MNIEAKCKIKTQEDGSLEFKITMSKEVKELIQKECSSLGTHVETSFDNFFMMAAIQSFFDDISTSAEFLRRSAWLLSFISSVIADQSKKEFFNILNEIDKRTQVETKPDKTVMQ